MKYKAELVAQYIDAIVAVVPSYERMMELQELIEAPHQTPLKKENQ